MFAKVLIGVDGHAGGRDVIALASQPADRGAELILANVHAGIPSVQTWAYQTGGDYEALLDGMSSHLLEARAQRSLARCFVHTVSSPSVSSPSVSTGLHRLAAREPDGG